MRRTALCLLGPVFAAAQLVGPGAVTSYTGAGRQSRSYGTVRDPAAGFYIGGSSLREMNGVYARVAPPDAEGDGARARAWVLFYENEDTGWTLGLAQGPAPGAGYAAVGGKATEWLLVDPSRADRFGHEGETVICGAGEKWEHLHRHRDDAGDGARDGAAGEQGEQGWGSYFSASRKRAEQARARAAADEAARAGVARADGGPDLDDADELPWQVVSTRLRDLAMRNVPRES